MQLAGVIANVRHRAGNTERSCRAPARHLPASTIQRLRSKLRPLLCTAIGLFSYASNSSGQTPPDPARLQDEQRQAMAPLRLLDGAWRGTAWVLLPNGQKREFVQTERIGPLLGGTLKVIEGRGFDANESVRFNAFGIVSYDPRTSAYTLRSYAQGLSGDFPFAVTKDGYEWRIERDGLLIRYTATVTPQELHEVGDRIVSGREQRIFEMHLKRVGDVDWPAGGAIPPN